MRKRKTNKKTRMRHDDMNYDYTVALKCASERKTKKKTIIKRATFIPFVLCSYTFLPFYFAASTSANTLQCVSRIKRCVKFPFRLLANNICFLPFFCFVFILFSFFRLHFSLSLFGFALVLPYLRHTLSLVYRFVRITSGKFERTRTRSQAKRHNIPFSVISLNTQEKLSRNS